MEGLNLNYLTVITAAVNLALGAIVLSRGARNPLNLAFFIFTVLVSVWAFVNFYFAEFDPSLFMLQSQYSTGGLVLVGAFPWVLYITNGKVRVTTLLLLGLLAVVVFTIPYLDGLLIGNIISLESGGFSYTQGPLFTLYGVLLFLLITVIIYLLFPAQRKASGQSRQQLSFVLIGIVVFAAVSVLVNVVLPGLKIFPVVAFDTQSSLIWVALTTYAITKYGLFNIKIIATQVFVGVLIVLILGRVLTAKSTGDRLFELIILVSISIVSYFLVRSVQGEVSRREEVEVLAKEKTAALGEVEERNKNLATLQRISDIVLNESEIKIMAQKILDEIPKQLESCAGALLSIVQDSRLVAYAISSHQFSAKVLSLVGGDLEKYSFPVERDFNLSHAVLVDKEPHDSDSLSDFISPPISKAVALTIQRLIGARHIEAFPLYAGGEPFGVLMFVFTEPKDRIHEQNHSIAKAIADDMSLAIQRAQAYQKLKEANEYLAELDKMKDEFISMASHELNTPLAAIEGYLSMVLDEGLGKVDSKAKEYLTRAYSSSKRLAELILDLLNVSRIEQGRLKMRFAKAKLVEIAKSVINELQLKAESKKLYLKLEESSTKLPETYCDPDRIREVFVNLVGNAIKFTQTGGITIKISEVDGKLRSEVVDTGRGISPEGQKKLFQKFSQVKSQQDEQTGTGLGLYISKNFVELHNGTIGVESEVGRGAKFFFEIPVLKSAPKEVAGAILDKPANSAQIETNSKEVPNIVAESAKAK